MMDIVGVGSTNVVGKLRMVDGRKIREEIRKRWRLEGEITVRKVSMIVRRGTVAMIADSKMFGTMKIANKTFEVCIM